MCYSVIPSEEMVLLFCCTVKLDLPLDKFKVISTRPSIDMALFCCTVKPDPPLDVQVEVGPKEGTLLVTWLPVTLRPSGSSNGAPVAGYNIYVDGRIVAEVKGANGETTMQCAWP